MRRSILRHAFIILTAAFLLGLIAGANAQTPRGRLWMGSHLTGILVALMVAVVGLTWDDLRLGARASQVLWFVAVPVNYFLMATLGFFAPALGIPQPIATPALPAPAAWLTGAMATCLVIATISSLTLSGLVVYGLRRHTSA
jgi:hypothetical protein